MWLTRFGYGCLFSCVLFGCGDAALTGDPGGPGGPTAACGDGRVDAGEVCDDGNESDGDGCSAACDSDETCGNLLVDEARGETCDDGNSEDDDGCSACAVVPFAIAWGDHLTPRVAAGSAGAFAVVWTDATKGLDTDIALRRYASGGAPLGAAVQVNASGSGTQQWDGALAADASGGLLVVWSNEAQDGDIGVNARRYAADGSAIGGEFPVPESDAGIQRSPQIAALAGGGFAVVFQSELVDGDGFGIAVRLFDGAGALLGGQFVANETAAGDQRFPAITATPDGGFALAWVDATDVVARRFDAAGAPQGGEFVLNEQDGGVYGLPAICASSDSSLTATFLQNLAAGSENDSFVRRFDASGAPLTLPVRVHETTAGAQDGAVPSCDDDGGFVVAWNGPDGDGAGIWFRSFAADATPLGDERLVNTALAGDELRVRLARLHDGVTLATWCTLGDEPGIYAQRLDATGNALGVSGP